ncbi:MAG: LysM peptidoglycan-binding domain-containing protein [Deltaproteobacteria bacterium]|nr:LysM peptidoglycan-binding domain-containing protein [Deltaproteobacteria bacterium]
MRAPVVGLCLAALSVLWGGAARADVIHPVRSGDTLAAIAQRYYGDPSREVILVAANVLHLQSSVGILPGTSLVVPSVSYYRTRERDTWERIAQREFGTAARGAYLAEVNRGQLHVAPSPGAVVRVPYLLRYVVAEDGEALFEIARRFYGDRAQARFVTEFNRLTSMRLTRGQVVLLPMPDLLLREEPTCEGGPSLAQRAQSQREVQTRMATLASMTEHGQSIEALALGARLLGGAELSARQRAQLHRTMAHAYCALDRVDLAAESLRAAIEAQPDLALDEQRDPPRMLDALAIARGQYAQRAFSAAPPTARPDEAR